eukprot:jgi/Chrpa1/940/Chrysochromulina_OHIO_Genome00009286-RA
MHSMHTSRRARAYLLFCCCVGGGAFKVAPSAARPPQRPAPLFDDPLNLRTWQPPEAGMSIRGAGAAAAVGAAALPALLRPPSASAVPSKSINSLDFSGAIDTSAFDPANFQPVCPASDSFYRFGQGLVVAVVGPESYKEYAPLVAGGLLRVRLELCVVESFVYEAIIPFIKENGLSWVLPLHETVETFLAGTVFAIGTNFILLGSTKIITVIATYADIFFGFPFRIVGGLGWRTLEDKALAKMKEAAPPEKPRPWCASARHCTGVAARMLPNRLLLRRLPPDERLHAFCPCSLSMLPHPCSPPMLPPDERLHLRALPPFLLWCEYSHLSSRLSSSSSFCCSRADDDMHWALIL